MNWFEERWDTAEDIGHGIRISYYSWAPDRELNPQYAELPDVDKAGIFVYHRHDDGHVCVGNVRFRIAGHEEKGAQWDVISLDPLHIEPSILQKPCGLHGFIRDGRWQPA